MSDDLILSGAGSTTVASSELLERADRAALLASRLTGLTDEIVWAYRYDGSPSPYWGNQSPELHLLEAEGWLRQAGARAEDLATSLRRAAEGYGAAERAVTSVAQFTAAQAAYLLGFLLPYFVAGLLPVFGGIAVGGGLALALRARGRRSTEEGTGTGSSVRDPHALDSEKTRRMLRDPRIIALLAVLISSVDDAAAGIAHVPHAFQVALGDEGLGYIGVGTSAALLTTIASGRLRESAVTVGEVGRSSTGPPGSLADLAARIPPAEHGKPQVAIERYLGDDGQPSWVVYVGGTIDASLDAGTEPWDMTSNMRALARVQAGSVTATMKAMTAAGIAPSDPLILVGHSQGGLVASAIAASDRFGRGGQTGLLTFGSPTGQLPLPKAVDAIGIEHLDDPIPALGGVGLADNPRLLVRRQVFTDTEPAADAWLPAHAMERYVETAVLLDEVTDARLGGLGVQLGALDASSTGTRGLWWAERLGGG